MSRSLRLACLVLTALLLMPSPLLAQRADDGDFRATGPQEQHRWAELTSALNSEFAARLSRLSDPPRDVVMTSRKCGHVNAHYMHPNDRNDNASIVICSEIVTDIWEEFRYEGWSDEKVSEAVASAVAFIIGHELGHAVIDLFDLPFTGRQENVADQFATLFLIEQPRALYYAARYWKDQGDFGDLGLIETPGVYWDEHGVNDQRFYNMICWMYGANPGERWWLVENSVLPESRAERCPREFKNMTSGWSSLLEGRTDLSLPALALGDEQQPNPTQAPSAVAPSEGDEQQPDAGTQTVKHYLADEWSFAEVMDDQKGRISCNARGTINIEPGNDNDVSGYMDQVGECTIQDTTIGNNGRNPIRSGEITPDSITFIVENCTYRAAINPTSSSLSGTVRCRVSANDGNISLTGSWSASKN